MNEKEMILDEINAIISDAEKKISDLTGIKCVLIRSSVEEVFLDVSSIKNIIEKHSGLEWVQIEGRCRKATHVRPRHVFCKLACDYTEMTLGEIGWNIGGRDHSSVIHGRDAVTDSYIGNKSLHSLYLSCRKDLESLKLKIEQLQP